MNNIQEKDWADDTWCGHTGMDNSSEYSIVDQGVTENENGTPEGEKMYKDCVEEK